METYSSYQYGVEQFYATKEGGRKNFSAFQEIDMPLAGGPYVLFENPAGSTMDLNVARLVISSNGNCKWQRRRTTTDLITNRGPALPVGNRGGGANSASGKLYSMKDKTLPPLLTPEKSVFIPAWTVYNVAENGCIVLRPGQCIIWAVFPEIALKIVPTVSFELVWWETPKKD